MRDAGRIFQFVHAAEGAEVLDSPVITSANVQQIVAVLLESIRDLPHIAEKVRPAYTRYIHMHAYQPARPCDSESIYVCHAQTRGACRYVMH